MSPELAEEAVRADKTVNQQAVLMLHRVLTTAL
jgi:hypothetical protein